MHPCPPAAELQFLVGLEVGQICLDPWSTQIRFSDGGRITIEGRFEHQDAQGRSHMHQAGDGRDLQPVFLRELVQQSITLLQSEPGRLTLAFGNGSMLRLWSDASPFECVQIYPPGREQNPVVF
jgi:hypothetical protein